MVQDAVSAVPDKYKALFENERVRIVETLYGPGETSIMHSHPDLVAVALTPAKARLSLQNGQTIDLDLQAGEAVFVDGQEHTVENTGASEFRVILVELK